MLIEDRYNMLNKLGLHHMFSGKIDGYGNYFFAHIKPSADIPADMIEHVKIKSTDLRTLL